MMDMESWQQEKQFGRKIPSLRLYGIVEMNKFEGWIVPSSAVVKLARTRKTLLLAKQRVAVKGVRALED